MSVHVMSWVFDHASEIGAGGNVGRFALALVLANYASEETGLAYPSIRRIAERCPLSERHIIRLLPELVDMGVLEVAFPATNKRPTVYRFRAFGGDVMSPQENGLGVTYEQSRGDTSDKNPGRHLIRKEPSRGTVNIVSATPTKQRSTKPKKARHYSPAFEAWWARYPKGSSKARAFDAWKKLDADEKARAEAGLDKWLACERWQEPRYVKGASAWLSEAWFDDEPPATSSAPAKSSNGRLGESERIGESLRYFATEAGAVVGCPSGAAPVSNPSPTIVEAQFVETRESTRP